MGTVTSTAGATEVTTGTAMVTVGEGHQRDWKTARATEATEGVARATTGTAKATGEMSRAGTGTATPRATTGGHRGDGH